MGDCTSVTLIVRKSDFDKHEFLQCDFDDKQILPCGKIMLAYYDVNHANLEFEPQLHENRVPYNKLWDAGDEFSKGSQYHRILVDGTSDLKVFYNDSEFKISIEDAALALKEGRIAELISEKQNSVMSWDVQEALIGGS